jgi:hypothetical protein
MEPATSSAEGNLEQALSYVQSALEILDSSQAPADIGAHLDLAMCRLQEFLGHETSGATPLAERSAPS